MACTTRTWFQLRWLGSAAFGLVLVLTVALTPSAAHAVSFSARSFAAAAPPAAVAVGDFNADLRLDLATANDYYNSVSILRGNGSGVFSAPANVTVTGTPNAIAVGDFNGDSRPDLVTANLDSNNVSILLANGSGGFSGPTSFAAGSGPNSIAVGHFNGDTSLDLVTANYRSSSGDVSILLGNGSGGFSAPTNFDAGDSNPYSVAVGNFNGDVFPDLAVANSNFPYDVSILLGNGSGGFSGPTNFDAGTYPTSVAVGNFNADAFPDLAVANTGTPSGPPSNLSILLGNGSGGFSGPTNFIAGGAPSSVAVGDFNGDSRADLAVANHFSNDVSILAGNGSGGFSAPSNFGVGLNPNSVAVGDFNGDARPDLATANLDAVNSVDVTVLLNTTSNGYPRPKATRPARVSLVPAYNQCTSPNRVHGPPDLPGNGSNPDSSCSPPAQSSGNLTVGTADANGAATNSTGSIRLRTLVGTPGGIDDSDVQIVVKITDVRCQAGVSTCGPANLAGGDDYTGEVQARIDLRITDRYNAVAPAVGTEAATGNGNFLVTVPCGASPTPNTIGSTCGIATTADAVYGDPSTAKEGRRAVWGLGQVAMNDGGADGSVATAAGNTPFMRQGVFVP